MIDKIDWVINKGKMYRRLLNCLDIEYSRYQPVFIYPICTKLHLQIIHNDMCAKVQAIVCRQIVRANSNESS